MSKPHYFQRYDHFFFSPRNEARRVEPREPFTRERLLQRVAERVKDSWQMGDWIYNGLLYSLPDNVEFDGTAGMLSKLAKQGYIERPVRPWPKGDIRIACLVYSIHTSETWNNWSIDTRSPGLVSYANYLAQQGMVMRHRGPSAMERESYRTTKRKPQRVKR